MVKANVLENRVMTLDSGEIYYRRGREWVLSSTVITGDSLDVLPTLESESIDAVVTDPPYGLEFMGKDWDHGVPGIPFWLATLGVLKPGGYLLAFGGTRTYHRLTSAIEDAGFEIRDCIMWIYGSGYPKGKGCLKPAYEPIILARKPGRKVLPLNVDACRIPLDGERNPTGSGDRRGGNIYAQDEWTRNKMANGDNVTPENGRWPANVIHDGSDEVMEAFAAFGERRTGSGRRNGSKETGIYGKFSGNERERDFPANTGSAARFFYCAKASKAERGIGNNHPTVKPLALMRYLVKLITQEGDNVLDLFLGSGSTAIAAAYEGRVTTGIELSPEYAKIAIDRIAKEHLKFRPKED